MFGKCQICDEKDKRITELKAQIETLTQLLLPSQRPTIRIPLVSLETDTASGPSSEEPDEDQIKEMEDVAAEANRILTGNY